MTEQMSNLERQLIACSLALEQIAHKIDSIGQYWSFPSYNQPLHGWNSAYTV